MQLHCISLHHVKCVQIYGSGPGYAAARRWIIASFKIATVSLVASRQLGCLFTCTTELLYISCIEVEALKSLKFAASMLLEIRCGSDGIR